MMRAIVRKSPQHEYHLYCTDPRGPEVVGLGGDQVVYHVLRPSVRVVSMMTSLPVKIRQTSPKVFHAIIVPPPFLPSRTIMHMPCSSLLRRPEFYPMLVRWRLRFLLHRAVHQAALITCPSVHVQEVMMECFGLSRDRLPVVHPGAGQEFRPIPEEEKRRFVSEKYGLNFPYFLFSGRWEKRKNVERTLHAFARFKQQYRSEHRLVFTGGKSWHAEDAERAIAESGASEWIVDLGKTPVSTLPYLYGAADALVYASLWEGFGLPIVEAMACGTPVITSNISAMPETSGGAAVLVNPESEQEIADAMERLASAPPLRRELSELGMARAQEFTWEKAADATLNLYEAAALA